MSEPSVTCPVCNRVSYNPNDIREGYCGFCHDWTGRPAPPDTGNVDANGDVARIPREPDFIPTVFGRIRD